MTSKQLLLSESRPKVIGTTGRSRSVQKKLKAVRGQILRGPGGRPVFAEGLLEVGSERWTRKALLRQSLDIEKLQVELAKLYALFAEQQQENRALMKMLGASLRAGMGSRVAGAAAVRDLVPGPSVAVEDAAAVEWQLLLREGEAARVGWLRDGLLISSAELASAWGRTRQALAQAEMRGELFSVKVGKNRFYPAVFRVLEAEGVKLVCSRLGGNDAAAKFVFWDKPHESLGGLTAADAIRAGACDKVMRLADAWSAERGFVS